MSPPVKRVIIDVDAGGDDALALLIFLSAELLGIVKIEAITCVRGNTDIDNVLTNVLRILEAADRTDIPVYKGAASPFIPPELTGDRYYGKDGFGDLTWELQPNSTLVKNDIAAIFMGEFVRKNPNEIYIVGLGPCTNLALAIKLFPDFYTNVKGIHLMGGTHEAIGNIQPTAEFNFYLDPEAVSIIFKEALNQQKNNSLNQSEDLNLINNNNTKIIHLLTWETTLDSTVDLKWRFETLGAIDNPIIKILNRIDHTIYPAKSQAWKSADGYMAMSFLYPEKVIKLQESHWAGIELHGEMTRGQVVINHKNTNVKNVNFIKSIDIEMFKKILLDLVTQSIHM